MGRKRSLSNRTSQSQNNVDDGEVLDVNSSSAADSGYVPLTDTQQDELAKRISRMLLWRQHRKRPVRRADLSSYALKLLPHVRGRPFSKAFNRARDMMRQNLALEVKEIQKLTKRKVGGQSRSVATASQAYGYGYGAKGYILVSNATKPRLEVPDILCEIGFLTLIAALIALQPGCRIEEDTLHHMLSKLGVHVREKQGHKQLNNGNVKDLLEVKFIDMWYLEKEKEDNVTYYLLGPRLRAELSDDDLLEFIHAVYKDGPSGHGLLDENGRNEIKARLNDAWGPEGPPDEREEHN
ncbi:unnamed protein product [Agarophyton chilense]